MPLHDVTATAVPEVTALGTSSPFFFLREWMMISITSGLVNLLFLFFLVSPPRRRRRRLAPLIARRCRNQARD